MSKLGGYKIIDLKDVAFTTSGGVTSATVAGVYEAIEGNFRKALLLSGLTYDDVAYNDVWVTPVVSGDDYVIVTNGLKLVIDDDDKITLSEIEIDDVDGSSATVTADLVTAVNGLIAALTNKGIIN